MILRRILGLISEEIVEDIVKELLKRIRAGIFGAILAKTFARERVREIRHFWKIGGFFLGTLGYILEKILKEWKKSSESF